MKKSWNLPSSFLNLEKVWKMEIKSGKMVKSLEFFFQSYNKFIRHKVIFCFVLVKSYSVSTVWWKELYSCIFKGLYWSPSLEKEIIVLEKRLEKVLNFGSKNLYEPWTKEINVLFIAKPQDHFFCFVPQSLDVKSEF